MDLEACLPAELRGPDTSITRVAAGLSGAGVYRVERDGRAYVLKVSSDEEPLDAWRRSVHVRRLAADAGLTPRVVHADEARRAVVSDFVVDRSFRTFYRDPRSHDAAVAALGRTIRRVHALPLPASRDARDPREVFAALWARLGTGFRRPAFVDDALDRLHAEPVPESGRAPVLSHNDVNPSNLVYDGERILLFDWETCGVNDPFYDLAAASAFLRMDEATCARLIAAYDDAPVAPLPPRFRWDRRFAATMCGVTFLHLAHRGGHPGAAGDETPDTTPSLGELHERMMAGAVSLAAPEGQWLYGLAIVKQGEIP